MTVFKRLSEALFGPDTSDTEYYSHVAQELAAGHVEDGLWARALADTGYVTDKARARYITLRVSFIKDQVSATNKAREELVRFRANLDVAYRRRDYATCFTGWTSLARQDDSAAMYSLAYLYAKGQGTGKDNYLAYYWATRAELAGVPSVQPLKNELIPKMNSWDIKKAENEARSTTTSMQLTSSERRNLTS